MSDPQRVQSIFGEAVQKPESERAEFLERVCGGDSELRGRVEALIAAHDQSGSFLDSPPKDLAGSSPTIAQSMPEQAGSLIGPFKLLQQIGEGGMGAVFMAEQIEPVERRVALKIIKPGMDTKAVIARFEAERQALAMMDHPGIAKVLDVGTTNSGRPYFVMELVRGVPITQYCDEHQLTPRQRLELFLPVCQAVQHAHQKGIIHRDIKPSNVLVAEYDDRPVPKIIDFGLAKAMEKRLTAKTMFTEFGQIVGTPDYMSPEQAKLNQMDIDTRSDIYSLGVLLYELLSGNTPFDRRRMRSAAFDELLRIIREEEPPRPSQRLSTVDTLPSIAANRHITPAELTRQLSGELDWIVMKSLEKDRSRRYDTATGLASDIRRFLNDEPVQACPPSTSYRIRKFARRNKAPIAMATALTLGLVMLAIGSTIAASRFRNLAGQNAELAVAAKNSAATATTAQQQAEAARDREQGLRIEAQRQTKIATEALVDARQQRERAEENFALARSAVDQFLNHVTKNELLTVPGLQPLRQELLSSAMEFYDDFAQDEENSGELLVELAAAHYRIAIIRDELGQMEEGANSNAKSIELFEKLRDEGNDSLEVRVGLAKSLFRARPNRYEETASLCREILEGNAEHPETRSLLANVYNSLALGDEKSVEIATALEYHQQALALRESLVSQFPDDPNLLAELGSTLNNLGVLLSRQNKNREALVMYQRGNSFKAEAYALAPQSIQWGRWLSIGLKNVATTQASFGEQDDALKSYERCVAVCRKLAFENPAVPSLKGNLHRAWMDLANYQRELNLTAKANHSLKAAQEVLENIPHNTPAELFDLALVYGALSLTEEDSTELSDEDETERQRYADLAIETIAEAVKNGFSDVKAMKSHKSLAALRDRDDFHSLFKELRAKQLAAKEVDSDEQKLANRRKSVNLLRELVGDGSSGARHRKTLAATMHSIGEIQIGLQNYDAARASLQEALQTSQAILDEQPDDPQASLNVVAVEYSQGRLHMAQGRNVEAHRVAQGCLDKLLRIARSHRENQDIQREIAILERRIYQFYGRAGLFSLARDYAARSAEFQRARFSADIPALVSEGEFSAIVLLDTDREMVRAYLSQFAESVRNAEYQWTFEVIHLVRVLAAAGETDLLSDELLARFQEGVETWSGNSWVAVGMAMVHYHYDRFPEAQSVLEKFRNSSSPQVAFLDAAVAAKLGDDERARRRWSDGETRYRQICHAALNRGVADDNNGIFNEHWWQFAYGAAMRKLALEAMSPGQAAEDPWLHLIQARGYEVIGEKERAEVELAAALAASANSVDVLMARIQLLEQWNDNPYSAEAEWQRIVELAADDPLAWIHRGRWYMRRGEKGKAEADYAKAASLTPNELNKFLEAGWWVAGPYPPELSDSYRPEFDRNLSKPLSLIDVKTGGAKATWLDLPQQGDGAIDPRPHFNAPGESVCALAYIYSPHERTELMRVSGAKRGARVWWNGRSVLNHDGENPWEQRALRIPVVMRPGLNEILLQTPADEKFRIQLSDNRYSRIYELAEQGLWKRAVEALLTDRRFSDSDLTTAFLHLLNAGSLVGDQRLLNRLRDRLLVRATNFDGDYTQVIAAQILVLTDDPSVREHAEEIMSVLRQRLLASQNDPAKKDYCLRAMTLYAVLLGNSDEASQYLEQVQTSDWHRKAKLPLRAIVLEHRQQHDQAVASLEKGLEFWANERFLWYQKVWYLAALRHAEHQVTGVTTRTDEIVDSMEKQALETLKNRDPKTAAFDHLVETYQTISSERVPEYPYLMRARRLTELGRYEDADQDLLKALEITKNDADVQVARAEVFAIRGEHEKADALFAQAYGFSPNHPVAGLLEAQSSPDVIHSWNFARGDEGWKPLKHCVVEHAGGTVAITSTGADPFIGREIRAPAGTNEVTICARVEGELSSELYWVTTQSREFSPNKSVRFVMDDSASQWRTYRVYFHTDSELINLRFDPCNVEGSKVEVAWATLANRSLDDALAAHPRESQLYMIRAERHMDGERWEQAAADFAKGLKLQPSASGYLRLGKLHRVQLQNLEESIALCTQAMRLAPNDSQAIYERGRTYLDLRRYSEAIDDFTRAIEIKPSKMLYAGRSMAYFESGDLEHALADAKTLIRDYPESYHGYDRELAVHAARGDWEQAREVAKTRLKLDAQNYYTWAPLAMVHLSLGDKDAFRTLCQELLDQYGETADPLQAGGLVELCTTVPGGIDDPNQLIPLAEKCLAASPENPVMIYPLVTAYYRSGRYEEALKYLNKFLEPDDTGHYAHAWLMLALTHHQLGHTQEARECYDRGSALLDDPARTDPWSNWWIGRISSELLRGEANQLLGIETAQPHGE